MYWLQAIFTHFHNYLTDKIEPNGTRVLNYTGELPEELLTQTKA